MKTDKDRFKNGCPIEKNSDGTWAVGNVGGPGRPPGSISKYNQIRCDLLDCWEECRGKERFKNLLTSPFGFEKALQIILAVAPKLRLELREDADGARTMTIQEGEHKEA